MMLVSTGLFQAVLVATRVYRARLRFRNGDSRPGGPGSAPAGSDWERDGRRTAGFVRAADPPFSPGRTAHDWSRI